MDLATIEIHCRYSQRAYPCLQHGGLQRVQKSPYQYHTSTHWAWSIYVFGLQSALCALVERTKDWMWMDFCQACSFGNIGKSFYSYTREASSEFQGRWMLSGMKKWTKGNLGTVQYLQPRFWGLQRFTSASCVSFLCSVCLWWVHVEGESSLIQTGLKPGALNATPA